MGKFYECLIDDLVVYVQQTAWLQTAPQSKSKNLKSEKASEKPMTRMQQIEIKGGTPDLPPMGAAGHLIGYLFDAGPISHGAMGAIPLSHADLMAWQMNTGIELQTWESRALRRLSTAYVGASQDAQQADCPPFFIKQPIDETRQAITKGVRSILGARTHSNKKGH